jgi:uncharacterized protein
MRNLCDSNVFLAFCASGHPHHPAAVGWLDNLTTGDTAEFCRATQISFLRLLTTTAVLGDHALSNNGAVNLFRRLIRDPRIAIETMEPADLEPIWMRLAAQQNPSPMRWMDAYLAAFCLGHGMRLITFDRAFAAISELNAVVLP